MGQAGGVSPSNDWDLCVWVGRRVGLDELVKLRMAASASGI